MHLRNLLLPRPSVSSPLDDKAHPIANTSQALDLEGLHRGIHDMVEHMRIKNKNNAHLIQHLTSNNLPPPPPASILKIQQSRCSHRSGVDSQNDQSNVQGIFYYLEGFDEGYKKLSPGTIDSFNGLSKLFIANFMSYRVRQKNAFHLFTVHQKETESLKDYVKQFNQAILEVEDPSNKVVIMAMMEGLHPGPLFDSLLKNVPKTLLTLQSKVDKYISAEELAEAKRKK
ncbi:hypothetical protein Acr_08g0011920 [Actinidia rufa]|uniref:Retrotransposon gag domain-containing protein n=1 Tax=Actinidia rufa TaxID=165716 RepID=A0A7J0F313_9ERIC|nr:hypothetical protein Acr_08g0011920 [Actinidia rufa]